MALSTELTHLRNMTLFKFLNLEFLDLVYFVLSVLSTSTTRSWRRWHPTSFGHCWSLETLKLIDSQQADI